MDHRRLRPLYVHNNGALQVSTLGAEDERSLSAVTPGRLNAESHMFSNEIHFKVVFFIQPTFGALSWNCGAILRPQVPQHHDDSRSERSVQKNELAVVAFAPLKNAAAPARRHRATDGPQGTAGALKQAGFEMYLD